MDARIKSGHDERVPSLVPKKKLRLLVPEQPQPLNALSLLLVADAVDRAGPVVGDEHRTILGENDVGRPAEIILVALKPARCENLLLGILAIGIDDHAFDPRALIFVPVPGSVFGDEGSGAWIGKRALGVVAAAADGREPPTALTGSILTAAEVGTPDDLIPWAIAAGTTTIATLAPVVIATAAAGDARANAIVSLAAEELVVHVRALALRLFGDERATIPVALSGGLLKKGSLLRKRLEQRIRSAVPGAQLRTAEIIPARGAVRLAIRRIRLPSAP